MSNPYWPSDLIGAIEQYPYFFWPYGYYPMFQDRIFPDNPVSVYYRQETQALAALFPEDFRITNDPFSVGQQLLHSVSQHLEHLRLQIRAAGDGTCPSTAHLNCLDVLYTVYLGEGFQFGADISDPRLISYQVPFMRGKINSDLYSIAVAEPNNLEGLNAALPNRYSIVETRTLGSEVLAATPVSEVPGATLNDPSMPGYLYLTLAGLGQRGIMHDGQELPAAVHLTGITTKGTQEEEIIEFSTDLTVRSWKRYQKVVSLKPLNIVPDTATLTVATAEYQPAYHIDLDQAVIIGRQEKAPLWGLISLPTGAGIACYYLTPGTEKSIAVSLLRSWLLLDDAGSPLSRPAFCLVPHQPYLAVVDGNKLFFYRKELEYPSQERLQLLLSRTDGCLAMVESDRFFYLPGETAEIMAKEGSGAQKILRYRWEIAPPGSSFSPYGAAANRVLTMAADPELTWIEANYQDNRLSPLYFQLALSSPGYWGVALETIREDGTKTKDVRLIGALQKSPLVTFDLSAALTALDKVFVDADEHLWIGHGTTAKRLRFHKDLALVDYQKKIVLLYERYDEVEVIP